MFMLLRVVANYNKQASSFVGLAASEQLCCCIKKVKYE